MKRLVFNHLFATIYDSISNSLLHLLFLGKQFAQLWLALFFFPLSPRGIAGRGRLGHTVSEVRILDFSLISSTISSRGKICCSIHSPVVNLWKKGTVLKLRKYIKQIEIVIGSTTNCFVKETRCGRFVSMQL